MDIVARKRAVLIKGISGLCIANPDVLDDMEKRKVFIADQYRCKRTEYAPLDAEGWKEYAPVHLESPDCPLAIVSTDRDTNVVLRDPFA